MTAADGALAPVVVADTGPLLCAGGMVDLSGVNLLWQRYHNRGVRLLRPRVVQRELENTAKYDDLLGHAALKMINRRTDFISIDETRWIQAQRKGVREDLNAMAVKLAEAKKVPPKLLNNDGEVDAILLAEREGAILLSNDHAGLLAAKDRGLEVATFAHVLSAEVRDGRMTAEDVGPILDGFRAGRGKDINTGLSQASISNVTSLPAVPGL